MSAAVLEWSYACGDKALDDFHQLKAAAKPARSWWPTTRSDEWRMWREILWHSCFEALQGDRRLGNHDGDGTVARDVAAK